MLVNCNRPELTTYELKSLIMSLLRKEDLMNEQGRFQAITLVAVIENVLRILTLKQG